ncbi:MAG: hypothetical protein IJR67_05335 [Acholeplasmatales bacterium]|nr:hypothetical protein [Acholeplasmatales bacterium]
MAGYELEIDNIYNKLLNLINQYEKLDDNEPFTPHVFSDIKNALNVFKEESKSKNAHYLKQIQRYEKELQVLLKQYDKDLKKLDEKHRLELRNIDETYIKQVQTLKDNLEKNKSETKRKCAGHEDDITFYISSSIQNVEMFLQEHENSIKRLEYQFENAEASYATSVAKNNTELEKKLAILNKKYDEALIEYDKDTEAIKNSYDKDIEKTNNELNELVSRYNQLQELHKNQKYDQSVILNNKIRTLADETNQRIVDKRKEYTNNQNISTNEKEEKHKDLMSESQTISKEFVLNMTQIDEEINKVKSNYNQNFITYNKNYEYNILRLTRELEKEIVNINSSSLLDAKQKRQLIRKKQRDYYSIFKMEKKKFETLLEETKINYLKELEKNNYERKLLDIERTYKIKEINEQENRDNKYYQEQNNLEEADLNYRISILNHEYNKIANNIRLDSNLIALKYDSEFERITAEHQKEVEKLITKIKKINVEIESADKIHSLIHKYEDDKHNKTVNYHIVHNLLEIEKYKVLNNFNKEQYLLNKENADLVLEYSRDNINIQNDKYRAIKETDIEIDKKILEIDETNTDFKTQELRQKTELETEVSNRTNQYKIDELSQNLLTKRFNYELKCIEQSTINHSILVNNLEILITKIIDIIFEQVIYDDVNLEMIRSFFKRILALALDYYSTLITGMKDEQFTIIDERFKFEEEFKFKSHYTEANKIYDSEYVVLKAEKDKYTEELAKLEETLENQKKQAFTIQSQLSYIKDSKTNKSKEDIRKTSLILSDKIKNIYDNALEVQKKIDVVQKKVVDISAKIAVVNKSFEQRKNNIKQLQYTSANSYYEYKKILEKVLEDIYATTKSKVFDSSNNMTVMDYDHFITEKRKDIVEFDRKLFQELFDEINKFRVDTIKGINKSNLLLLDSYNKDIEETKKKFEDINNEMDQKFEKIRSQDDKDLTTLINKQKDLELLYDNKIKLHDNSYNRSTQDIIDRKNQSIEKFYSELYATCDNQSDIVADYKKTIEYLDVEYKTNKKNIIEENMIQNQELKDLLNSFITKKDELIKSIPDRTHYERVDMNNENKIKNKDIDNEKIQARLLYNEKKKELEKTVDSINLQLQSSISNLQFERKNIITKEKKAHVNELKKIAA